MSWYISHQVKGAGRGAREVVPTINLEIPAPFPPSPGVYAGYIELVHGDRKNIYDAAIHYGPRPVYDESSFTLECYLIDAEPQNVIGYDREIIKFQFVEKIRDIMSFSSPHLMLVQIQQDVAMIRQILAAQKRV